MNAHKGTKNILKKYSVDNIVGFISQKKRLFYFFKWITNFRIYSHVKKKVHIHTDFMYQDIIKNILSLPSSKI